MSWLYSQALVEEYLGENSLDGEPSVQLSGNPTQQAYCAPDKMTDFSRLSRFGMTYKPLMESRGQELLTLYLADFHAKTLAQQEKAQELTESEAECGEKWHASFTKYDPDSSLWKTHQCSLLGDLDEFLETWPQWGLMRDGECWEQRTLVQTTNEKESGLWLTPSTVDIPTRSVESMEKRLDYRKKIGRNGVGAGCLSEQVNWSQDGPPIGYLTKEKMFWGTPKAQDSRHALRDRGKGNLGEQVSGLHNGGKLNPMWVEWLMGWPLGWTDLKPLEMDKSHSVPQLLGEF